MTGGGQARSTPFRLTVVAGLLAAATATAMVIRDRPAGGGRPAVTSPATALHPVFSDARPLPAVLALDPAHGRLWATRWSEQLPAALLELDPATLRVIGHRELSAAAARRRGQIAAHRLRPPAGARFGGGIPVLTLRAAGGLWVAVNSQGPVSQLWQLDPATGRVISRSRLPAGFLPVVGAASGHTLWLATGDPRGGVIRWVDLRPA
jgi:hypothetical protein